MSDKKFFPTSAVFILTWAAVSFISITQWPDMDELSLLVLSIMVAIIVSAFYAKGE